MKKTNIKLISLLLVLCMVFSMFEAPLAMFTVNAADDPVTPTIPSATKYYVNNDFETTSDLSGFALLPKGDGNVTEIRKGNTYIYMEKNTEADPQISRDFSDVVDASYVAVEVALATTKHSGAALKLTGTAPEAAAGAEPAQPLTLDFISIDAEGKIYTLGTDTGKILADDGKFVKVTVAVNSDANTYTLWIGDKQVVKDVTISAEAFGKVSALTVELNGDVTNASNLMVDDLKVYRYVPIYAYLDFNTEGETGVSLLDKGSTATQEIDADGNGYVKLYKNAGGWPTMIWDYYNDISKGDQVVYSFDIAVDDTADIEPRILIDTDADIATAASRLLWFEEATGYPDGKTRFTLRGYYNNNGSTGINNYGVFVTGKDNVVHIDLAMDVAKNTYSVWTNGTLAKADVAFVGTMTALGSLTVELVRTNETAYIDNLAVYGGTEYAAITSESLAADGTIAVAESYIEDSFDDVVPVSELVFSAGDIGNKVEVADANQYVYLELGTTGDPQIYRNFGDTIDSDYVVVSADIASTHFHAARFYFNGSTLGPNFRFENNVYKVYWGSSDVMNNFQRYTTSADGTFKNVTVVFDYAAGTFAYWFDGTLIKNGTWSAGRLTTFKISLHNAEQNLMIDNLKIYSYAQEPSSTEANTTAPATTAPSEPGTTAPSEPGTTAPSEPATTAPSEPSAPVDVYYNNDFSSNADGIDFATMGGTSANYSKYDADGKYLYLRCHNNNGAVAFWNKGEGGQGLLELPDQFVVSFDVAAVSAWANFRFYLVDENGNKMQILWNRGDGGFKRFFLKADNTIDSSRYFSSPVSSTDELKFRNITLAFDMNAKTYSYWSDNYNANAIIEDLNLPLPDESGTFGTPQYIELQARGDNEGGTTAVGGNLIIDNLKIYSGKKIVENVGPQNKFPPAPPPEEPVGDKVWYNNDFNQNANGITVINADSKHVLESGEGYLYFRRVGDTKVAYWNRGTDGKARAPLTDKFVISLDMSSTALSDGSISIVDEKGETIEVINFTQRWNYLRVRNANNDGGVLTSAYTNICWNGDDGRNHHMEVAINTETGKFSLWKEGNLQLDNLYLDDADGSFGTVQYIVFSSNDTTVGVSDDGIDHYYAIDNLKIYSGSKPGANIGAVTEQPTLPEDAGFTPPAAVDPSQVGTGVYYNNDFSNNYDGMHLSNDASSILPLEARKNIAMLKDGKIYLWRTESGQPSAYWNRNGSKGMLPLSDYFVVSFDLSSTSNGPSYIYLFGENGAKGSVAYIDNGRIRFYRINDAGGAGYNVIEGKLPADGTAVKIDLAFNIKSGTYSAWADGKKLFNNERFVDPDTFGKAQYIRWYVHNSLYEPIAGTDQQKTIPTDLMLDNLQIYDGLEPKARDKVGKVNVKYEFPRPEGVNPGNGKYYESDFENKSTDELVLNGGSEITKEKGGNHSIKMNLGASLLWNYSQKWELSEYVVYETTIKAVNMGTLLYVVYGNSGSFYTVKLRKTGELTPAHAPSTQKLLNGESVNVAVAINSVDNTYSVWYDGVLVLENSTISSTPFGTPTYLAFRVSDGEMATTEWRVDNLKVYQGFCPDDYANTVQLTEQPKDESWLDEMMGTQSRMLNYATEELAAIKSAGAVMVNTNTLYIYKDGKRTQGTKAQVDAILKKTSGKKVIKNGLGLVIIGPKSLELTDAQIAALHDYMIYVRPSAKKLTSLFKSENSGHPRVILTPEKLKKLRSDYKNNDFVRELAQAQIRSADLAIKSKHYEFTDQAFQRGFRDRWPKLALAYLLTGEAKYKDFLWEDIVAASKFPNWKPNDALMLGDASYGIAIAYDWLYDAWTPAQRKLIEETIYDKILYYQHRAVYGKQAGGGTYWGSDTNRNAVSNGGPGMAMIAVFDVYPEKIADIMEKTYHLIEIMMDPIAPDGANTEGPAYWDYQMRYLVPFLQSSLNTFGTDFNLMDAPGFDRTADFYLDIDGMTGVNNLHDATADNHGIAGEVFGLADMLGRPDLAQTMLAKYDVYNTHDGFWTLIYYNSDIKYDGTVDRDLDSYYQGLEFVSMRSSWLNSAGIYASLHAGGHDGASHNHVDIGSFVLDIGGQRFASDYGKEDYNLKAKGIYRHYYYRIRPEGHNVFVINPDKTGKDIGMNLVQEEVTKFVSKSRGAYSIVSMDKAYAGYAESAQRGMMLGDDRKSVLIRDEIRGMTKNTNEVWWFMQMENVEVKISKDGKSAILSKGGVDVHMQVASDAKDWEIKVLPPEEMYPLEGLPDQDKQNPNTNYTRLAIVFKTGKNVNINVKFAQEGDPKGDTPIKDVALSKWSIPEGILKADPVLNGIEIGGVQIPNFTKNQTFYNFELPYGSTECPDVKVIGGEGCNIEIFKPTRLPGYLRVVVTSKADSKLQSVYKITLTVSGPISVEVSDTPEPQNFAKNMLDGNLNTKWACNGAGWAKFTFPSPQKVDALWLCAMEMTLRVQPFDIEVSEDGVNFKQVWKGTTTMLPKGSKDQLQEFKIPEGEYKAIRINVTGAQYPDGRDYGWSSIFEVMFYYQGKPIEIILQTSDPDKDFTENPNDTVVGPGGNNNTGDGTGDDVTDPTGPDATEPSDGVDDSTTDTTGNNSGMVWLIVGLSVAAVLVAGAIILIIVLKKKKAAQETAESEKPADEEA